MSDNPTGSIPLEDDQVPTGTVDAEPDAAVTGRVPDEGGAPQTREQLLELLGPLSIPERRNLIGLLSLDPDEPFVYQSSFFQGSQRSDLPRYVGLQYYGPFTTFQEVRVPLIGHRVMGGETLRLVVTAFDVDFGWQPLVVHEQTLGAGQAVASFLIDDNLAGAIVLIGSDDTDAYLFFGRDSYPNAPAEQGYYGYSGTFAEFPGEGPQFYAETYTPIVLLFHRGSPADVTGPLDHTFHTAEGVAYALENANPVQLERIRAALGVTAPPLPADGRDSF